MIVLKANKSQHNKLNGYSKNNSLISFIKDCNGNYVIGLNVLDDPNFIEIKEKLTDLQRIKFEPIKEQL